MNADTRDRGLFIAAALWLVFTFIWALMPVDELPSRTVNALSIAFELGLIIGLVGLAPRVLRSLPEGASRGGLIFLLVAGVVAAVGVVGIRLAGGPRVELPPRPWNESSEAQDAPKRLRSWIRNAGMIRDRLRATRWSQALATRDPAQARRLNREDLVAARNTCRDLHEWIERMLESFAEAESKRFDVSGASTVPAATRPENWRVVHEGYKAADKQLGLIELHWQEWQEDPFFAGTNLEPWQREAKRLGELATAASEKFDGLIEPAAPN